MRYVLFTTSIISAFTSSSLNRDSRGQNSFAGLIADASGNLYGTTAFGGTNLYGTVFQLTPPATGTSWTETVLHSFPDSTGDEVNPYVGLIADASGNLYGEEPEWPLWVHAEVDKAIGFLVRYCLCSFL